MLTEAEAIPYEPAPLRGERLLVLAPHPDDEVIGCGGLIAHHLREGRAVSVIVATDGAKATGAAGDVETYKRRREEESRSGLDLLGPGIELTFLRFPDRGLGDAVAEPLREHLLRFKPDLVCVPSPVEIHPDHLALSRAFCFLIQREPEITAHLPLTRVAFYEISHPLRPNTLVDISSVADAKYAAIAAHASQVTLKDYVAYSRGLNAYRAMTLPPETTAAEGYWVTPLQTLARTPFSELRRAVGEPPYVEVTRATLPISVIIRTKNRPHLVGEAIRSVRAGDYPAEVVVVNDGGATPHVPEGVKLVEHATSAGRSEAMNRGVKACGSRYIAFLDDDDLFYPEHLPALANAASTAPNRAAWYTDALSVFLRIGDSGNYEAHSRLRLFATDFDRELLLVDNYIPLPTLLVEREAFLETGGFDPSFDLFEDWDFLIRLSDRGDFQRVPRVTCEVRHFEGGSSIVLSSPEGSAAFRDAKLQLWRKHASRMSNELFATVFERQKRRSNDAFSQLVESRGRVGHLELDVQRVEREKRTLIGELQQTHATVGEKLTRIGELELALRDLHDLQRGITQQLHEATHERDRVGNDLQRNSAALRASRAEVERLQGLLDMIFRSRTWKLHALVEKLRGRG
jgi:LmbE family N-acetylglucosaminyl deacetylase